MVKNTDNSIYFDKNIHNYLSNDYPCSLVADSITFNCVEQAYQYFKYDLMDGEESHLLLRALMGPTPGSPPSEWDALCSPKECCKFDFFSTFYAIVGSESLLCQTELKKKFELMNNLFTHNDAHLKLLYELTFLKFSQNEELKELLLDTHPRNIRRRRGRFAIKSPPCTAFSLEWYLSDNSKPCNGFLGDNLMDCRLNLILLETLSHFILKNSSQALENPVDQCEPTQK